MKQADLKEFLDALSPETRQLVAALRKVVRRTVPEVEESLLVPKGELSGAQASLVRDHFLSVAT